MSDRTAGPPPASAVPVMGDAAGPLQRFADLLADQGVLRGLIGPREVLRLWDRHVLNCLASAELAPPGSRVLDLGSGAGLPGVVWAVARPDLDVELVEPLLRRSDWLSEVVARLGLDPGRVRVTRARAEELHGRRDVDVVTARAVAPLARLAGWSLPLLRPGGVLLALKGRSAAEELERDRAALARLGTTAADVLHPGAGWLPSPTAVVRVVAGDGGPAGARERRGTRYRRQGGPGGQTRRRGR